MAESVKSALAVVSLTPTDGVMIVVGTFLIFVLYRFMASRVFAPLLEHVEQRESLTSGALHDASQMLRARSPKRYKPAVTRSLNNLPRRMLPPRRKLVTLPTV